MNEAISMEIGRSISIEIAAPRFRVRFWGGFA
ncbi:hypothetical protein BJ970_000307 [Saccharopolyspora phatthalungensis]|uniref:Uncharacterized protein n=1 Tax=Saccharopolyspora phatthalungensis TaxID=664693 RepID=A0A840Q7J4_9PSEU|nr:hypothetical protein [Saccharopolyspora phatthalungensis]